MSPFMLSKYIQFGTFIALQIKTFDPQMFQISCTGSTLEIANLAILTPFMELEFISFVIIYLHLRCYGCVIIKVMALGVNKD
jgi:hypothetical protein